MQTVNKYLMCCHVEQEAGSLCLALANRTRTNIWELHGGRCRLELKKNFLKNLNCLKLEKSIAKGSQFSIAQGFKEMSGRLLQKRSYMYACLE